ncbi:MAG: metalloprotease PmbA [Gammaproteobacteria bacterium]|nr:metalloprotease PmbA [Gammaproteobacteria bacterium]
MTQEQGRSTPSEQTTLQERAALEERVARILEIARTRGADSAEVAVSRSEGLAVSVRHGEVETVEQTRDQGFGITVYLGRRKGSASTSDSSENAIAATVEKALSIARYTAEDPAAGLADAELMPGGPLPDLDLCHAWDIDVGEATELARICEAAALGFDERITNSDGANVNSGRSCRAYGNSHGFIGSELATRHGLSVAVIAGREGGMQRDYAFTMDRSPAALEAAEEIGRRAGERTVARLGARPVPTARVPVLFSHDVAAGLLGHLVSAISGGNLYRRSSFLLDALGQQIFPQRVQIEERPHLPRALGSASFDGDGVATRPKHLVADGKLTSYVLSAYSARRLGLVTTGNAGGVHNLRISDDGLDLPALLARLGRGLLVTELMGQGVNGVTGDYSRGAAGFWVENGEISHPVQEVTVAGNLREMFLNLDAIGNDTLRPGNIVCGSLLIDGMTLSGS